MTAPHDPRWRGRVVLCILNFASCILVVASCAVPKPITLPSDPGSPFPDFAAVHTKVASACSGVRTLTTVIGLSGQAGNERLRGRVIAGFERPSSMRLEAVALGQPVFIRSEEHTSE